MVDSNISKYYPAEDEAQMKKVSAINMQSGEP